MLKNAMIEALDLIDEGVIFVDQQGQIVDANRAAAEKLGQILGLQAESFFGKGVWGRMRRDENIELPGRFNCRTKSSFDGWIVRVADMSHLYDALTGAYTRAMLMAEIGGLEQERIRARIQQRDAYTGVLFIDVDDLKKTNNEHGHDAGDKLLKKIAIDIHDAVRVRDLVARYGGDEFVVIASRANAETVAKIARRIRSKVSEHGESVSIGAISLSAKSDMSIESAIKAADKKMYEEKAAKKQQQVL